MRDSFTLYLSRLNTDVELCQSLRRLLADEIVMSSLDPETRYLLMLTDLDFWRVYTIPYCAYILCFVKLINTTGKHTTSLLLIY